MENTIYQRQESSVSRGMGGRYLIIIDHKGNFQELSLDHYQKEQIFFGRDPERCDIVISFEGVSRIHGKFKLTSDKVLFADLGSTNGTILDTDGCRRYIKENQYYIEIHGGDILRIQPEDSTPENSILMLFADKKEGTWQKIPVSSRMIQIGRDGKNDIVLSHPGVSRVHASIKKTGHQVVLTDNHSMNGLLVNGKSVDRQIPLEEKSVIRILDSTLIYTAGMLFFKSAARGINIVVKDVDKYIQKKKHRSFKQPFGEKTQILTHASCEINSNEFVAIVGGSGAGKTTLMNAMSGYDKKINGSVQYNGVDLHSNFKELKSLIGYVPQEDILYDNLVLKQMLYYTARLKMPKDTSKEEIDMRIAQVLQMVNLSEHADKYIRKLSGGQKKRASIAVELLADPSVFFLDEPTSGLDPGTEQKLMETLKKLSKTQSKTIVMVTHMVQNLELCDKVIFMGNGGRICFCGTIAQAKEFFETDTLVDIYFKISDEPEFWAKKYQAELSADWKQQTANHTQSVKRKERGRKEVNLRQISVIGARYVRLIFNGGKTLLWLLGQPIIIACLLAFVAGKEVFTIYDDTKAILFTLSCSAIWLGLFNSIQEICKERAVLKREYMGNLRLPFYVFAKFLVQTMVGLLQSGLMVCIFALLIGVPEQGILLDHAVWEIFVTVWLTIEASMALGFVISSVVKSGDKAMMAAPFILIVQLLFSGMLFELKGAAEYIAYVTISKWSVESLGSIADLNSLELRIQQQVPMAVHEFQKAYESTSAHLFGNWGVLLGMMLVCAILCNAMLHTLSKDGR